MARTKVEVSEKILRENCEKMNLMELAVEVGCSRQTVRRRLLELGLRQKGGRHTQSPETRAKLSVIRKAFLEKNPEKHPWRFKTKFKSKPCELLKEFLQKRGLKFMEEYQPNIKGRYFSIDIAFPEKMLAIEVNGNQHYERDGSLKPYYQVRHDLLEKNGWTVIQIHYSLCFNVEKLVKIFSSISSAKFVD